MEAIAHQADFFKLQVYNHKKLGKQWKTKKTLYRRNEIDMETLKDTRETCEMYGIELICTVNTTDRVELIKDASVNNVKIASGQIHSFLVDAISEHKWERVFVSTGMLDSYPNTQLALIDNLYDCAKEVIMMHTVSLYPTHDAEANLSRISTLKESYPKCTIGYSDHLMDDLACVVAMGMGAEYIEKHMRIEGSFGPTSEISCIPKELGVLAGVRNRVQRMWGNGGLAMQLREYESFEHYRGRFVLDGGKVSGLPGSIV